MSWDRPTLKQIYERIARDFSARLQSGADLIATSAEAVLARIWAGAAHLMHGFLAWAFLQVFVDTAEGVYLERWARVWGFFRKDAASAKGRVAFPSSFGRSIEAGRIALHQESGLRYAVEETVFEDGGTILVTATALEPGIASNLRPGSPLQFISPIPGVKSQGAVDSDGITGGVDVESDDGLRGRLLDRLRQPPRGGAVHDYIAWAKEMPGVTRAWCYPHGKGIGTVTLCFVCDNDPVGLIPSQEMVNRVQAHIEKKRPATAQGFEAFAPDIFPLLYDLRLVPDTDIVRSAVADALQDLVWRTGEPGATILLSHSRGAVGNAAGVHDYTLLAPVADIVIPGGCFPILEEIRFEDTPPSEPEPDEEGQS